MGFTAIRTIKIWHGGASVSIKHFIGEARELDMFAFVGQVLEKWK